MKNFHVNPEESIFIHKDIKSKKSIGMHFGTFVLTAEPVVEPIEKIKSIIKHDENFEGEFMIPESIKKFNCFNESSSPGLQGQRFELLNLLDEIKL